MIKIQYGGLTGLKVLIEDSVQTDSRVDDIVSLVSKAMDKFTTLDAIPMASITASIMDYKAQRRRKK